MKEEINIEIDKRGEKFIQGDTGEDIKKIYALLKGFADGLDDLVKRVEKLEK